MKKILATKVSMKDSKDHELEIGIEGDEDIVEFKLDGKFLFNMDFTENFKEFFGFALKDFEETF